MGPLTYLNLIWFTMGVLFALSGTGCGKSALNPHQPLTAQGSVGAAFRESKPLTLEHARVVNSSALTEADGSLSVYYDYDEGKAFARTALSPEGAEGPALPAADWNLNFTYVFRSGGRTFLLGERSSDIFLSELTDGEWLPLNGGEPIIRHNSATSSNWNQLWNAAADVRPDGTWLLFIECADSAPNQAHVGLCYAEGALAPAGRFTLTRQDTEQAVPHGGNPYVKYIPGKGLLIAHGILNVPHGTFGWEWYVTVTTRAENDSHFLTHTAEFSIGTPGIHVADPHLAELADGRLLLTVSSDQSHIAVAYANLTLNELYANLTGSN